MKKFLIALLSILMVLTMVACGGSTEGGTTKMTMGTGGTQGTYYAYGAVLGSQIKNSTDISVNAVFPQELKYILLKSHVCIGAFQ